MSSEAHGSHAQSFLGNSAFLHPSTQHLCMHSFSSLLQTTYLTYSFTCGRISVVIVILLSKWHFTKQNSSALCDTSLQWMLLIECYLFSISSSMYLNSTHFRGEWSTVETFRKLTNKICDCVRRGETGLERLGFSFQQIHFPSMD